MGADGSSNKDKYMTLAADIAHTCHESYDRSGMSVCLSDLNDIFCVLIKKRMMMIMPNY